MKSENKKNTFYRMCISAVLLAATGLLWTGCGDTVMETKEHGSIQHSVSKYDGQPIIELDAAEFYRRDLFDSWRSRLVSEYGEEIVEELNQKITDGIRFKSGSFETVLIKQLSGRLKGGLAVPISTHVKLIGPDGETEAFLLGVRRYINNASQIRTKSTGDILLSSEDTWLAMSPDRFYLQDDDRGNELWPITFPAVSLSDEEREIEVTFDKDGFVSSTLSEQSATEAMTAGEELDLVFVEAVPIIEPCPECDGGGSGSGETNRINDWGRGKETGYYNANATYFSVKSIRLAVTGDGDGASELQMFVKNNDNYNYNYPNKYKYRFDRVVRLDPVHGGYPNHSIIAGGDKGSPYYIYYEVPDINNAGTNYQFDMIGFVSHQGSNYSEFWTDHFPLFNLTQRPGPWRIVLSDDDKDYQKFSRRRQSEFATGIHTYHMNDGSWRQVYTGFTVERKTYGSSDDPQRESGVRRITLYNSQKRQNSYGNIVASKNYTNGTFKYVFVLSPPVI